MAEQEALQKTVYFANEVGEPLEEVKKYNKETGKIIDDKNNTASSVSTLSNTDTTISNTLSPPPQALKPQPPSPAPKPFIPAFKRPILTRKTGKHVGIERMSQAKEEYKLLKEEEKKKEEEEKKKEEEEKKKLNQLLKNTRKNRNLAVTSTTDLEEASLDENLETADESDNVSVASSNFEPNTMTENTEQPAPPPVTTFKLGPKEKHLLRIGLDSSSEYIEVGNMPFKEKESNQAFAQLEIGSGIRDLTNLYNVRGEKAVRAMVTAFGVPRLGGKPPILDYIKRGCAPEGIDLVRDALNYRIKTLKQGISIKAGTEKAKLDKHRLEFIQNLLKNIAGLKVPCVDKPAEKPIAPQQTGCPCLQELSLLRDLIFLILVLQGNADPAIKEQLYSIPLEKVLQLAEKNNLPGAQVLIKQALQKLKGIVSKKANKSNQETQTDEKAKLNEKAMLEEIYRALKPKENVPENLDINLLLSIIEQLNKDILGKIGIINKYKNSEQTLQSLQNELDNTKQRLDELLAASANEIATKDTQIAELLGQLGDLKKQKEALEAELLSIKQELQESRSDKARLYTELGDAKLEIAEQGTKQELKNIQSQKTIQELESRLQLIESDLENKTQRILDLTAEITQYKDKIQAQGNDLARLVENHQKEKAECEEKINGLTNNLQELQEQYNKLSEEKSGSDSANNTVMAGLQSQINSLQKTIDELNTKLMSVNEELESANQEQERLKAEAEQFSQVLAGKDTEITKLQEMLAIRDHEKAKINEMKDQYKKEKEEVLAKITDLTARLEAVTTECAAQKTDAEFAREDLLNQITASKIEIAKLKANIEQYEAEVPKLREKAQRANDLSKSLSETSELLEDNKNKLKECEETAISQKNKYESDLEALNTQLEVAKQAEEELRKQLEAAIEKETVETGKLRAELQTASENIQRLENELAAKGSSQSQAETLYETNKKELLDKISTLETELKSFQDKLPEERLAAAEEEKKKCDENIAKKEEELSGLKQLLEEAQAEAEKAKENAQARASALVTSKDVEAASKDNEITELKEQINTLEQNLETSKVEQNKLMLELAEMRSIMAEKLSAKNNIISSLQSEVDSQKDTVQDLRSELLDRPTTETVDALVKTGEIKNSHIEKLEKQHEDDIKRISDLEQSLTAVESMIPSIQLEKQQSIDSLSAQLKEVQESLAQKTKECDEEKVATDAEVSELKAQVSELEAQLPGRDDQITVKNTEIQQLKNNLGALRAEKRQGNTAVEAEIQRLKSEITAKEAELMGAEKEKNDCISKIGDLQANIDKINAEAATKDAENKNKIAELSAQVAELEQEISASNLKLKNAPPPENIIQAKTRIAELEAQVNQLTSQLESAVQTEKEETKKRLENLLSKVLIDDELTAKAQQYLSGEADDISLTAELQEDLCEFFRYLIGLINLQLNKISSSKIPADAKKDIFSIFEKIPAISNPNGLLIELSNIFQELFVGIGKTKNIPHNLELAKDYPITYSILSGFTTDKSGNPLKVKEPGWASRIMTDVGSIGYMINTGIQPGDDENKLIVRQSKSREEFQSDNKDHFVPLSILAIKLIQLLGSTFTGKYKNLAKRCGIPIEPLAGYSQIKPFEIESGSTENKSIFISQPKISELDDESRILPTPKSTLLSSEQKAKEAVDRLRKKGLGYTRAQILSDIKRFIDLTNKSASSILDDDKIYNKRHLQELIQLYKERAEQDPRTFGELPLELKRLAMEVIEKVRA